VFDVHPGRGIGDRQFVVTSAAELRNDYTLGIGSLELDLSRMQFPPGTTYLETRVDVGDLQVIMPPGVALRGYGEARAGHVNLLGKEDDGWNADVDLGGSGARVLDLVAHVGAGSVRVERAVR
jgi:predicted membrane protein